VLEELIDWSNIPDDPIFQLTFPQSEMLDRADFLRLHNLLTTGAGADAIQRRARKIQMEMNPHPAGQMELNVPSVGGKKLPGFQHKYRETVLFFPYEKDSGPRPHMGQPSVHRALRSQGNVARPARARARRARVLLRAINSGNGCYPSILTSRISHMGTAQNAPLDRGLRPHSAFLCR
jgi:hypothetical protein